MKNGSFTLCCTKVLWKILICDNILYSIWYLYVDRLYFEKKNLRDYEPFPHNMFAPTWHMRQWDRKTELNSVLDFWIVFTDLTFRFFTLIYNRRPFCFEASKKSNKNDWYSYLVAPCWNLPGAMHYLFKLPRNNWL